MFHLAKIGKQVDKCLFSYKENILREIKHAGV